MKKPLVSVLMPAYNAEKYIGEAIESILNQTFKDFEFIIIDDASTDGTWEVIQRYAKKDRRIIALRNKQNIYIAKNRNALVALAKGKYIAWQDADDISVTTRLKKQVSFMEKHHDVGELGGYLLFFDEKNHKSIRTYATDDAQLRKTIFRYSPVAQPTAMIRRECFEKLGSYNVNHPPAEDIDMSFRIGILYKFANLPFITLQYRQHSDSATFSRLKKIELSTLQIRYQNNGKNGYRMSIFDKVYNVMQYISVFLIIPHIKIQLFNLLRNTKKP